MSKFAGSGWDVRVTLGPSPESPVMVRSARDIEQAPPGEIVFAGAIASLKPSTTPDQEWP
ncbi:MAG: hypothetical protein LBK54_01660 [Propionibacteriaceae bacterium]|nr:hypothetical protein [Propionibacteriaceae bacterium]